MALAESASCVVSGPEWENPVPGPELRMPCPHAHVSQILSHVIVLWMLASDPFCCPGPGARQPGLGVGLGPWCYTSRD